MSCSSIGRNQSVCGYSCRSNEIFSRSTMKSVLAICTLFLAAALVRADEDANLKKFMEATKEHFEPCVAEVGMSIPTGMPSMTNMPTLSPENMDKLNCVHACVMKRLGIMDGGKIVADKMKEFMEQTFPEEAAKMMKDGESCIEEANGGGDECGVVKIFVECVKKFE
ncbi:general odorant-binding protein 28a-like [Lasioglossum baleicum]|uniref:general odorant-binding protein 28a-like n=1 Tax=Lasioglossum baleicum TaxID=434251 RepID=UPI003FCEAFF7